MTEPISIEYLEKIQSDNRLSQSDKDFIAGVLESLVDWRNEHAILDKYLVEIEKFTGGYLTEKNIRKVLRSINVAQYAWEAECLAGLARDLGSKGIGLREAIADVIAKVS
ncbi:MAG: hypothetical protein GQ574_00825 [Crocinitomix sp.]|nr:hypothetical protein [Crocinitomix sp.]